MTNSGNSKQRAQHRYRSQMIKATSNTTELGSGIPFIGSGSPVILLHGGLGHSGNWGYQVPALVGSGYHTVLIDSRGHGRSTRDAQPFSYELIACDVLAVMDALHLEKAGGTSFSRLFVQDTARCNLEISTLVTELAG